MEIGDKVTVQLPSGDGQGTIKAITKRYYQLSGATGYEIHGKINNKPFTTICSARSIKLKLRSLTE